MNYLNDFADSLDTSTVTLYRRSIAMAKFVADYRGRKLKPYYHELIEREFNKLPAERRQEFFELRGLADRLTKEVK